MAWRRTWGVNCPQCATSTGPNSGMAAWPAAPRRPKASSGVDLAVTPASIWSSAAPVGMHLRQPLRGGDPLPSRDASRRQPGRPGPVAESPFPPRTDRPAPSARPGSPVPVGRSDSSGASGRRARSGRDRRASGPCLPLGPAGRQAGEERLGSGRSSADLSCAKSGGRVSAMSPRAACSATIRTADRRPSRRRCGRSSAALRNPSAWRAPALVAARENPGVVAVLGQARASGRSHHRLRPTQASRSAPAMPRGGPPGSDH